MRAVTIFAMVLLITLHAPNGLSISINPTEIATLRETKGEGSTLMVDTVRCVVGMSNGKWVSVIETCEQIREAIKQAEKDVIQND